MATSDNIIKSPLQGDWDSDCDIFQCIEKGFETDTADKIALVDVTTGASVTFSQLKEQITLVARSLYHDYGFRSGDRFAFYSPNQVEYVVAALAVWKLRGIVSGINPLLKPDEVRRELEVIECKYMFAHSFNVANAVQAIQGTEVKHIFVKGNSDDSTPIPYETLLSPKSTDTSLPDTLASPDDVAAILFSSGTTGLPKGTEITHKGFTACIYTAGDPSFHGDCDHRVVYQPFSHMYGIGLAVVAVSYRATLHIFPRFDLKLYLKCVTENKVNNLTLVPPIAVLLVKSELDPALDFSCIEMVYNAAAPLMQEIADELNTKLGGNTFFRQLYGLTETSGLAIFTPPKDKTIGTVPPGSIGVPVPGCEAKICSLEDGSPLGPGERGELCMRGSLIMRGYAGNKQATDNSFDEQGWFKSGDIGYYDENGYIFVVDRLKELVKYKGYQVAPAELENLLLTHPSVADSGVVGLPDLEAGELPYAWVVRKPGAECTEEEIQAWVAERVAAFKKLRGGVKFVDVIPKSLSGKILRREIRAKAIEEKGIQK